MTRAVAEPPRIARLDHDKRGYPIPYNVLRAGDGTPFYTVNDDRKAWRCIREGLCPICGERLGQWKWIAGGPRSAFDPGGCYLDLPMHKDCIEFALQTCPYLSMPKYLGRVDIPDPSKLPPEARVLLDDTVLPDRPEIFVAVAASRFSMGGREWPLTPYLKPEKPWSAWSFWRHGRQIAEDEAMPYLWAVFGGGWRLPVEWLG
jgi:hypothetical protein